MPHSKDLREFVDVLRQRCAELAVADHRQMLLETRDLDEATSYIQDGTVDRDNFTFTMVGALLFAVRRRLDIVERDSGTGMWSASAGKNRSMQLS